MPLQLGMQYIVEEQVTEERTARAMGSGGDLVAATPFVVLMMESAAYRCVSDVLDNGMSTVGTLVNIRHLKATPLGCSLKAIAKLIEIDRKRLVFEVEVFDNVEKVADGTHERFIVDNEKFMEKANAKRP